VTDIRSGHAGPRPALVAGRRAQPDVPTVGSVAPNASPRPVRSTERRACPGTWSRNGRIAPGCLGAGPRLPDRVSIAPARPVIGDLKPRSPRARRVFRTDIRPSQQGNPQPEQSRPGRDSHKGRPVNCPVMGAIRRRAAPFDSQHRREAMGRACTPLLHTLTQHHRCAHAQNTPICSASITLCHGCASRRIGGSILSALPDLAMAGDPLPVLASWRCRAGCPCRGGTGRQASRRYPQRFPAALSRSCRG
jgi:hypothetical protein